MLVWNFKFFETSLAKGVSATKDAGNLVKFIILEKTNRALFFFHLCLMVL